MIVVDLLGARVRLEDDRTWTLENPGEDGWTPREILAYLNQEYGPEWEVKGYAPDHLLAQFHAAREDVQFLKILRMDSRHSDPGDDPPGRVY